MRNADNDYELQVTVTDSGGLTDRQDITVTVTNLVEGGGMGAATSDDFFSGVLNTSLWTFVNPLGRFYGDGDRWRDSQRQPGDQSASGY